MPQAQLLSSTIVNFYGMANPNCIVTVCSNLPPDTNGDVSPTYYIQQVNDAVAVYSRTGMLIAGPFSTNTLWSGTGGDCQNNNQGDGIVKYDRRADRWLISQLAKHDGLIIHGGHECIAISKSPDPVSGGWYMYDYTISTSGAFGDYPKLAVWPDGYYMTVNWGQAKFAPPAPPGAGAFVFDRSSMLQGAQSTFQCTNCDLDNYSGSLGLEFGALPSDLDGRTPPPPGSPGYIIDFPPGSCCTVQALQVWQFFVNWSNAKYSSFVGPYQVPVSGFNSSFTSGAAQPGSAPNLEILSDRLMYRLAYRNFGDYESLVLNHVVNVASSGNQAGIRWYELRKFGTGASWSVYQWGDHHPDSSDRWMGSIAQDAAGDIALGMSLSSTSVYPSIVVAGQLATDPRGSLPQGELTLAVGGGSQTSSDPRWGDYTAMQVDPVDDCTFWYTNEYYPSTSDANYLTVIASFRFPTCMPPGATQRWSACTQNTLPDPANDDESSPAVALPFVANFFGNTYTQLYVNNNGNVTFDQPLSTYTPFGLTSTNVPIIAPYFADVDTRGSGSGIVTYGGAPANNGNPAYFCVNWPLVGYYNSHTDKLNSFQLILTDRALTGTAGDFDIQFNYDGIQWESGDLSGGGGNNGLGGTSARVGYSNGSDHSLELIGSGINGALLDGGLDALISGSQNSATLGRYIFPVRNGAVPPGGSISGTVTNPSGGSVSGARVDVCGPIAGAFRCSGTWTNAGGNYSIVGLPAGRYTIDISPPSGSGLFAAGRFATLAEGQAMTVDIALAGPQPLPAGTTVDSIFTNPDGTPVLYWTTEAALTTSGCPGGTATFTVSGINSQTGDASSINGTLSEAPPGSGTYSGSIPALYPMHDAATVAISITCPNPAQNSAIAFSIYIDPSGQVVDPSGAPVAGAVVTLLRADTQDGPYEPVPAGSALMSPADRNNPDHTDASGRYGWDVVAGYYIVRATRVCHERPYPTEASVQSPAFQVPPPSSNLVLTLGCNLPAGAVPQSNQTHTEGVPPAVPQASATARPGSSGTTHTVGGPLGGEAGLGGHEPTSKPPDSNQAVAADAWQIINTVLRQLEMWLFSRT